ncbi:MAG: isoleucine--tRNA ligase, partial [Chlamydiia bacterium]|nr:isoleucine--tRNA ligase [Chlamydiia bacterium]
MKGYHVPRRFGWDCHGIPVENEIEKTFNLSGAKSIEDFGIERFNEECRSIVLRYSHEWQDIVERMGRWVDFDHTYKTMDKTFMESVWWVFKQLWDKGLVYQGYKVMPFSAKLGTPLSNFEASENYKDVDDPSLTVSFEVEGEENLELLAWTTTPWTLISNLALMVGPDLDYVKVKDKASNKNYILAKSRLSTYYKNESDYEVLEEFKGKELENIRYKPLFSYFEGQKDKGAFRVILEPSVQLDEGTGIVQTAPAFGEVDFYACKEAGIDPVCPVDNNGRFTEEVAEYTGQFVKDADKDIIKRLKAAGKVVHHATINHRYPFCPRSDTPLIYRAVSSWFVSVEKIKEKILRCNELTRWTPDHIQFGRFGKWLEGARDWAISRSRYWGCPIPLWMSDDGDIYAIGSIEELEKFTGEKIEDLHRHFIDHLTFEKDGKTYKRIPEVFDCWFESGSMPYAQNHYPFENQEFFKKNFPADFIAEGLDQTRGWFYTLMVLSTALFEKPAFKNVVVNGILLASDGQKMSKRLKNYPDPMEVVKRHGADAVRLYMLHSPAVKGDDLCFNEAGVELVLRQVLIPLWNAYSFFITYARIYSFTPKGLNALPVNTLDVWILSRLQKLIKDVEEGMDAYDLSHAVEPFVGFVDELTNWYIRRSRRRFWSEEDTPDRQEAFETLYCVLTELAKVAAPFIPFITEAMYQNLRFEEMPESVHLAPFPEYQGAWRDTSLEMGMEAVQKVVSLGHALRKEYKLKVRQPLREATLVVPSEVLSFMKQQEHLIKDELNVKSLRFSNDDSEFVTLFAKPNFRVLGKKVGKKMRAVQQAIEGFNYSDLKDFLKHGKKDLEVEGELITLTFEDVEVARVVKEGLLASNEGEITILLNNEMTPELIREGLARELVNKLNTMRRDAKFHVSDRIKIKIDTTDLVKESFEEFKSYIMGEVLGKEILFVSNSGVDWDLNGESARIAIEKYC